MSGYRCSGLAGTVKRGREDEIESGLSEMGPCGVHLLHTGCREVEPGEVAVYDVIGIEDLTVADKVQVADQGASFVADAWQDCEL